MVPKKKGEEPFRLLDKSGMFSYLLDFDPNGRFILNHDVEIDFESMAKHILAVDDAARNNGLRIRKVILMVELQDELFNTKYGTELEKRDIYFVKHLTEWVNRVHDDHYHIDFSFM